MPQSFQGPNVGKTPIGVSATGSAGSFVGSGFDNVNNWPSIGSDSEVSNRPVTNTSTHVMTWIGPVGGGASTTSDTLQTLTLTVHTGDITTTANNQVISGLFINGNINIAHTGTIIRNCYLGWASGFEQINLDNTNTGVLIEDCEIDGKQGGFEGIGLGLKNCTVRRCNIHGQENGISTSMQGTVLVIETIIWGLVGGDNDGIEANQSTTNLTCTNCTFDWRGNSGFTNSGLNITNVGGGVTGVLSDKCRYISFANFAICDGDASSSDELWGCTNSSFFNCNQVRRGGTTCSPNSGNYIPAHVSDHSGTLVGGSGVI